MSKRNPGKQEKPEPPESQASQARPNGKTIDGKATGKIPAEPKSTGGKTGGNTGGKTGPAPKQSLWRATADVWPFIVGAFGCGLLAYFLTYAGAAYEQPNSLTTSATVLLMVAGACIVCSAVGLVHLGFSASARVSWWVACGIGVVLTVVAFIVAGMQVSPGMVFSLAFSLLCVAGFFLGRRTDAYRAKFPRHNRFLGDWD